MNRRFDEDRSSGSRNMLADNTHTHTFVETVSGSGISLGGGYASLHLAPDRQPCNTPQLSFYRPDALPAAQLTASKH